MLERVWENLARILIVPVVGGAYHDRARWGLEAALVDAPLDEWAYEVGGEPVVDHQEFPKRLDAVASISAGEFAACAKGVLVWSV